MPVNDPQVLMVNQVPGAPAAQMDYNFFHRTVDRNGNHVEKPATLCGISFFDELGGHDPANDEAGIELLSSQDTPRPPVYRCPAAGRPHPVGSIVKYRLTYEAYLNALYHNGLCAPPTPPKPAHFNYVRLFLGHQSGQDVHAFQLADNGKFNLDVVDEKFLNRLREFVEKARARGVVVCISLTSIQAIKTDGWLVGPFYHKNNNNGLERFSNGLGTFCKIVRPKEYDPPEGTDPATPWPGIPDCSDPPYNPAWTRPEKLYFIQHQLFRRVVETTRGYWNVVYEICNEASEEMEGVVEWHKTVARWLNGCLGADLEVTRSRLISVSADSKLLFNPSNPSDPTRLVNALRGQIDFISLHGGQWTNDPPTAGNRCNTTPVPAPAVVASKVQAAIDRYRGKGYALLFDADAAYWAQRSPTRYVTAVFARNGSFSYRWPGPMLREVVNPNAPAPQGGDYCKEVNGNFGLDQRLGLIRAGVGFDAKVTPFPLPAAAVPKNLAAAYEAGALKLTFGRPAPPANPKDPDTKPEGYVVYFGATAATVGQGAGPLPPRRYFQVANPESPQLTIPFTPAAGMRNVFVAVAAYNGPLVGERGNVVRVPLTAG